MNENQGDITEERVSEIFFIHFDLPDHEIPLSTFIETANETQAVIRAFNEILFEGKSKFEIYVIPPEDGSFLSKYKICFIIAGALAFVDTDIGKLIVKELTGQEPIYYAQKAIDGAKEILSTDSKKPDKNIIKCQTGATILIDASKTFLQKDTLSLQEIGITPNKYPDAFKARNGFYQVCDKTPNLNAIGFEKEPVFPVNRDRFASMQVAIPKIEDDEEEEWIVSTVTLTVTSPNWDRKDKKRQWKGKDIEGKQRTFQVEDEGFWLSVKDNKINPTTNDIITVQWAFQGSDIDPKKARVLKVLKFNDETLSEPLKQNALNSILGTLSKISENKPADLFGSELFKPK